MNLLALLQATFGYPAFRQNQEAVCRSITDGRDVLLVMPTGAGKSLCYQLPAIARSRSTPGSAALVVSPLIALMDDQAAKLAAKGLRVARIHSGLPREDARAAARPRLPRDARPPQAFAHCHRRGSLHLRLGPRLPPRLPQARRCAAAPPPRSRHRPHRDRDSRGPARHRGTAAARRPGPLHPRLSPRQPRH